MLSLGWTAASTSLHDDVNIQLAKTPAKTAAKMPDGHQGRCHTCHMRVSQPSRHCDWISHRRAVATAGTPARAEQAAMHEGTLRFDHRFAANKHTWRASSRRQKDDEGQKRGPTLTCDPRTPSSVTQGLFLICDPQTPSSVTQSLRLVARA